MLRRDMHKSGRYFFLIGISIISITEGFNVDHQRGLQRRRLGAPNNFPTIGEGCPPGLCGGADMGGSVTRVLLARAPPCAAQNLADKFITVAKTSPEIKDDKTRNEMIAFAKALCTAEKNTFDDYKTFPVQGLNSLYCTEPPKNPELNGLHFKQNKDNPPDRFLDPATRNTVMLDQFPGTRPLGESPGQGSAPSGTPASNSTKGSTSSNATAGATSAIETTTASTSSNETSGSITSGTASAPASVKTNVTVSSSVEKSGPPNGTTGLKGADFYATPGAKA